MDEKREEEEEDAVELAGTLYSWQFPDNGTYWADTEICFPPLLAEETARLQIKLRLL